MAMSQHDQVIQVTFDAANVYLHLADGRIIGTPLDWHPWLMNASADQRMNIEHYELAVYFPDLDDGLDAEEMIKGIPARLMPT